MLVEPVGKEWLLARDYTFTFNGEVYTIEKGFPSDGASIPTFAMRFFTHTDLNKMFEGSLKHDWFCANKHLISRKDASKLFIEDIKKAGVGNRFYTAWKLTIVYWAIELYQKFVGKWG